MLRRDRCGPGAGSCYRAIRPASCLPSSIRGRRGKGRRTRAPSRPASTNERRTRWTVIASRSRASLICWSDHAGPRLLQSALGRMRPGSTYCAADLPLATSVSNRPRSSTDNRTMNFLFMIGVKLADNWHGLFRAKWHTLELGPAPSSRSLSGSVSASRL